LPKKSDFLALKNNAGEPCFIRKDECVALFADRVDITDAYVTNGGSTIVGAKAADILNQLPTSADWMLFTSALSGQPSYVKKEMVAFLSEVKATTLIQLKNGVQCSAKEKAADLFNRLIT
jgi:hypothetical protein